MKGRNPKNCNAPPAAGANFCGNEDRKEDAPSYALSTVLPEEKIVLCETPETDIDLSQPDMSPCS